MARFNATYDWADPSGQPSFSGRGGFEGGEQARQRYGGQRPGSFGDLLSPHGDAAYAAEHGGWAAGGGGGGGGGRASGHGPLERGGSFGSELTSFMEQHEARGPALERQGSFERHGPFERQRSFGEMPAGQWGVEMIHDGAFSHFLAEHGAAYQPAAPFAHTAAHAHSLSQRPGLGAAHGMGGSSEALSPVPPLPQHGGTASPRHVSPRSISPRLSPRPSSSASSPISPGFSSVSPTAVSPSSPHSPLQRQGSSSSMISSMPPELRHRYEQATAMVEELSQLGYDEKSNLEKIRHVQRQFLANPTKEDYEVLYQQHVQVKDRVDSELRAIEDLRAHLVLPPPCIPRLEGLQRLLALQSLQIEVLHRELEDVAGGNGLQCHAVLAIQSQPFPMVVSKAKRMDDEVAVRVVTGAGVTLQSMSDMKASVVWDSHQTKGVSHGSLPDQTQACDLYDASAKFHLRFGNGTRKQPISMQFSVEIEAAVGAQHRSVVLESPLTDPLIVITNECQWEEGEGTLLRRACFRENMEPVPWRVFANMLQKHVVRGTRQDPLRPTRCITLGEFEYMHARMFGGNDAVTPNQFDTFWNWFGKTFQKVRYQRHVLPLWISGYIHSFASRDRVTELLAGEEPGTFLVRFSERNPGLFALAYRTDQEADGGVRHYLIRPSDTNAAKRTLPDFLGEHPTLSTALRVVQERGDAAGVELITCVRYERVAKDDAFRRYYSKKDDLKHINGYDDDIAPVRTRPSSAHLGDSDHGSYSPLDDYMNAE